MTGLTAVVAETTPPLSEAGNAQLLIAALVGIAVVVVLIVVAKFHPFLALILGTAALGAVADVVPHSTRSTAPLPGVSSIEIVTFSTGAFVLPTFIGVRPISRSL